MRPSYLQTACKKTLRLQVILHLQVLQCKTIVINLINSKSLLFNLSLLFNKSFERK